MNKSFMWEKVNEKLKSLYGQENSDTLIKDLKLLFEKSEKKEKYNISSKDIALITYANSVTSKKEKSLSSLNNFLGQNSLKEVLNSVHILPFYPWDTDRGFSVMDYYKVDANYGDWNDVKELSKNYRIMFDFVANHASVDNPLIQNSLIEKHLNKSDARYKEYEYYKNFVITYSEDNKPSDEELKNLARPRPNPVLTKYFVGEADGKLKAILGESSKEKFEGKVLGNGYVWTTFSRPEKEDGTQDTRQVDLNFSNPNVFLETLKILKFYIDNGASLIRLDAIGYIWKKLGSSSLHEPEAHKILEIIHDIISEVAPQVITISEVNEQQDKFFEYLGKVDHEEADMVYQFCPFPLAIYSVLTGNGDHFKNWYKTTEKFNGRQFITVLGSHDGLGLKPVREILQENELENLTDILVNKHGGLPNFAVLPGGKKIIYEICSTPWNLINSSSNEPLNIQIDRYIAVLALGLIVKGIPGIYFNGLVGADNYSPVGGLDENRTINRESFDIENLQISLNDNTEKMHKVFARVRDILKIRSNENAFTPSSPFPEVVELNNSSVIGLVFPSSEGGGSLVSLINVSSTNQSISLKSASLEGKFKDLFTNNEFDLSKEVIELNPYQVMWLK